MKKLISLFLAIMLFSALIPALALEDTDIVGDWVYTRFVSNGRSFSAEEYGNDGTALTFKEGGACVLSYRSYDQVTVYNGSWSIDGDCVKAELEGYNDNTPFICSLNEDGSLSYNNAGGNTLFYKRGTKPVEITSVKLTRTKWTYNGEYICPGVIVKAKVDGKSVTLERGKDYDLDYVDNDHAGKAVVIVKGKGNYFGFITKTFTISKVSLSSAKLSKTSLKYTGSALKPDVIVKAKVNGETVVLTKGTDYTVAYQDNTNVGTATVTIRGKGNFKGTITKTFKITPVKILKVKLSKTSLPYTGKARKPIPTVTTKVNGQLVTLVKGTDYTVKYENNVEIGTATITITGKGNYTGTIVKTFRIVDK